MRIGSLIMLGVVCALLILLVYGLAFGAEFFGDNVGIVSGTIAKGDSERGLTVRATPSATGAPMAWLPVGTKVHGSATFKNGYVKIEVPVKGGWVPMSFLTPEGGEGVVSRVDQPDMCLRIRSGPSTSHEKVGCAGMGQKLELTGIFSSNGWAQVAGPTAGWVTASQIESSIKPLGTASTAVVKRPSKDEDVEIWHKPATDNTIYVRPRRFLRFYRHYGW
jgi:hypothetical protein